MENIHPTLARRQAAVIAGTLLLTGCMSQGATRQERLAAYQAHAGAPVRKIHYHTAIGWEEVADGYILVMTRPKQAWLMRLSGPCLDHGPGPRVLSISSSAGFVSSGFDRVTTGDPLMSCRIEEIRPVDTAAMRAARRAAQASGT